MARYLNLPMQSNSSFQSRILNEIISAMNTIDLDPLPTDSEFLQQAQSVLFAGTFLPTTATNTMQWLPTPTTRTNWTLGGVAGTTGGSTITVAVNTLSLNTLSAGSAIFSTLSFTGNISGIGQNPPSLSTAVNIQVAGSTAITQATLPTIPPAIQNSFQNVTLTGNVTGTIGLIFNGNVLTMNINIQVATTIPSGSRHSLIASNFANTTWQNFINRLGPGGMAGTSDVMLDQWIAGTNNTMDDVRAILEISNQGLQLRGVLASSVLGQLNVGDRWNVMVTWAIT